MTQEQKDKFFKRYKYAAIWEHIYSGVPASITLAQAAIESSYGTSKLFLYANNSFGIKAYSNPDNLPVYYATDDLQNEPFRKYDSVKDSFADHISFLKDNARYNDLFNYTSAESWANGLKTAGYATNPSYNVLLMDIIKDNDLQRFDIYGRNRSLILFLAVAIILTLAFFIYKFIKNKLKK